MPFGSKDKKRPSSHRPSDAAKAGEHQPSLSAEKGQPSSNHHRSSSKHETSPTHHTRHHSNAGAAPPPASSTQAGPISLSSRAAKPTGEAHASSAASPSSNAQRHVVLPAGGNGRGGSAKRQSRSSSNSGTGGYTSMRNGGYGSICAGGYGSMRPGGFGSFGGDMAARSSLYGSTSGSRRVSSLYGMGGPMLSMYGMTVPVGSMYVMGTMPVASMYGMGGPMGSLYGIGAMPMSSMYGMGGMPMSSMYGMGGPVSSMYGVDRYNSTGRGSTYSAMYGGGGGGGGGGGSGGSGDHGHSHNDNHSRKSVTNASSFFGSSFSELARAPPSPEKEPLRDFSIPPPSTNLREEVAVEKRPVRETKKNEPNPAPTTFEARPAAVAQSRPAPVADSRPAPVADSRPAPVADRRPAPEAATRPAAVADSRPAPVADSRPAPVAGSRPAPVADSRPVAVEAKKANGETLPAVVGQPDGRSSRKEKDADKKEDGERGGRRGMPTALPSSYRLTKQVNDNIHVIAVAEKEAMVNRSDKSVKVGATSYKMDEVTVAPVDAERSDVLTDIVEQTHCGHNASMLVLCGEQPFSACTQAITAVAKRMMETFAKDKSQVTQVQATAVAFSGDDSVIDLLAPAAKPVKPEIGSNPISGPCVMNTSDRDIKSPEEAAAVVKDAAGKATKSSLVVVMYKIKQIRPLAGAAADSPTAKDVYVSSMVVAMVDDANLQYLKVTEKRVATGAALLFTNAIGGASRTAAIVHVPEKNAEAQMKAAVTHAMVLREIKNTQTRSGNVKRFIDYTERAAASNPKASPETAMKIVQMLKDAKNLMAHPEVTPLAAYNLFAAVEPSPSTPAEAKKAEAAAAPTPLPKPQAAAAAPVPRATPTADPQPAAAGARLVPEKAVRLVVCVDGAAPVTAEQVNAHELVRRAAGTPVPESATIKTLAANFVLGRNVALLSAETKPGVPLKDQYTWKSVTSILTSAFEAPAGEAVVRTYVELFMAVVQKRQVLCDLLAPSAASATAKALGAATSPLFGPILIDTVSTRVDKAADVKPSLEKALAAAVAHVVEPDALVVMTAVLKQVKENKDVSVASFMVASGPSSSGVRGAMSKSPEYSRSLFAYALGGPCVTALLVCIGDDHATSESAKRSLSDMNALTKQANHSSRDGSVMAFVDYAKKGLAANKAKLEKSSGEEKERLAAMVKRLQLMHDDYSALLAAPAETMPAYYMGDNRVSVAPRGATVASVVPSTSPSPSAGANAQGKSGEDKESATRTMAPIRAVAVLLDGGDKPAAGMPALTATATEITVGEKSYKPTEVVQADAAGIRSTIIDKVHKVVLDGYNAAIVTNDVGGSTVGISMAVKNITVILRDLPSGSEAFWSVTVSKDNKVKDMLADNSPYYDLHLASSPLFGNVPYGANIVPITEALVEPKLREVRNEVRDSGGVGYIAVILRLVQADGDVCVPSFLVAIAGDNVAEYEKLVTSRSSSALLGTAIGGPCQTVYVAGIRGTSGAEAQAILEMSAKMMRVQNGPLRSGSLRRFIAHTEPALALMQSRIEGNGTGSNQQLTAQVGRIATMLKDAQNMLNSPGGSAPVVYKR